jgi:hypothetical protein
MPSSVGLEIRRLRATIESYWSQGFGRLNTEMRGHKPPEYMSFLLNTRTLISPHTRLDCHSANARYRRTSH